MRLYMAALDKRFAFKQGLELMAKSKRAQLVDKRKEVHLAELELNVVRTKLISDQAKAES